MDLEDLLLFSNEVYSGEIIKFKRDRGFGFIRCSEISSEVFFHVRSIFGGENNELFLAINQRDDIFPLDVDFTIVKNDKGFQARDVRLKKPREFVQHLALKPIENLFRLERIKSEKDLVSDFFRLVNLKSFFYINRDPVTRRNVQRVIIESTQAWEKLVELSTSFINVDEILSGNSLTGVDASVVQSSFSKLGNSLGFLIKGNTKPDYFPALGIIKQQVCQFSNPLKYFREDRALYITIVKNSVMFANTARKELNPLVSEPNLLNLIIILDEDPSIIEDVLKESRGKIAYISQKAILDAVFGKADEFKIELGRIVRHVLTKESLQPFVVGSEYNELLFAGRLNERFEILDSQGLNYIIYGGRKIGKTWLVKDIIHRCKKEPYKSKYYAIYRTLQSVTTIKEAVDEIEEEIRNSDDVILPRSLPDEPLPRLKSILTRVNKLTGRIVLLALDEVDDLLREDMSLFARLRQIQDNNAGAFKYIFAGFKDLLFATTEEKTNNPFANFKGVKIPLSCLSEHECQQLVIPLIKASGFDFKPDENAVLQKIYDLTSGHPYYTQLLCRNMVDDALRHGEKIIYKENVDKAASHDFYSEIFSVFEDNLSNLQKLIGKIFAENNHDFSDSDIQQAIQYRFQVHIDTHRINKEMRILQACSVFSHASPTTYRPLMPKINNKFFEGQDDHRLAVNYLEKPNEY